MNLTAFLCSEIVQRLFRVRGVEVELQPRGRSYFLLECPVFEGEHFDFLTSYTYWMEVRSDLGSPKLAIYQKGSGNPPDYMRMPGLIPPEEALEWPKWSQFFSELAAFLEKRSTEGVEW